jgi:hypothetical protein
MLAGGGSSVDTYNDAAYKSYNEKGLIACPNCARTFLPDSLKVHIKSCNKAHGKEPEEGMPGVPKKPAFIQRPKTIVCYVCGREYGTASIDIHLKSCKQKWEFEENKKPMRERRPVPEAPKQFEDVKYYVFIMHR